MLTYNLSRKIFLVNMTHKYIVKYKHNGREHQNLLQRTSLYWSVVTMMIETLLTHASATIHVESCKD